jgi:hypothetical protein
MRGKWEGLHHTSPFPESDFLPLKALVLTALLILVPHVLQVDMTSSRAKWYRGRYIFGSQTTSIPPTLTVILIGKGEIPEASVIRGTAARPLSEDVYVSIVCIVFVRVAARLKLKVCRSTIQR